MGISTEYSSTVDHMNCSKTMVSGEQVLHSFLNRRPTELLKDDGILMQQMQFSESLEFQKSGEACGSQNRILLNRRPHENLKDDGIWRRRATFFTKIGVPSREFWRFVCELTLNQKHRFGPKSTKFGHLISYEKHRSTNLPHNHDKLT